MHFLLRDEWEMLSRRGALTNLSLAWSRDSSEKTYVQQRIRQAGAELWQWFEQGAHFYVCGDAGRMARDVDAALRQIVQEHGAMTADAATDYLACMSRDRRYARDVY